MTNNCTVGGCHAKNAPTGDLTTYNGVTNMVTTGSFQDRVLNKKDMPPSNTTGPVSLSSCDLEKLQTWINKGNPQ